MIKLVKHGNNEIEIMNESSTQPIESIFFSYSTAVAGLDDKGFFKTAQKYSSTTTKHINKWLTKNNAFPFDKVRVLTQKEIELKLEV